MLLSSEQEEAVLQKLITETTNGASASTILEVFPQNYASPAGSLMRENQDTLEVTGISASGVNVVIHV